MSKTAKLEEVWRIRHGAFLCDFSTEEEALTFADELEKQQPPAVYTIVHFSTNNYPE